MTDELQAISVGLGVNLGKLDADLASIQKKITPIKGPHKVTFIVGAPNLDAVRHQIRTILSQKYVITPSVGVSAASAAAFRRDLKAELAKGGAIPINVKISDASIGAIKRQLAGVSAEIKVTAKGGGGSAGPASSAALTPHERAVNQDAAVKVARAVKANQPVVKAAPAAPVIASAPAGATAAPPARAARPATASRAATPAPVVSAAPAATASPLNIVGERGPSAYTRLGMEAQRFDAKGNPIEQPRAKGVGKYLQKQADKIRRVTIDRSRGRAETPEEGALQPGELIGFGSPMTRAEQEAEDARGRGVRGASRANTRRRNEPTLTPERELDIDTLQRKESAEVSARREEELRAPSRRSGAFYGSSPFHPALRAHVDQLQFYKFDPKLGEAFEALSSGNTNGARDILRGFSSQLATADPRKRKKFFRLFNNVEKVPPELLEKHSALQSIFTEISHREAEARVAEAEKAFKAFPKPKGPQAGWSPAEVNKWQELLDQKQTAVKWRADILRGLARRAAGGPVQGGGLLARIKAAEAAKNAVVVNERHEEAFIGKSGASEHIKGGPQVYVPPEDGEIVPFVPVWMRNPNRRGKDLTGRAGGGPVRGFGGKSFRSFAPGEKEAISSGLLTRADSASVQRVFVVNLPPSFGGIASTAGRGGSVAAGPFQFSDRKSAAQFADTLGGSIGKQLKELLGQTVPVEPKEPRPESVGPVTAAERQSARKQAQGTTAGLEQTILGARSATAEAQQLIPVRSLSVAVGQIFSTLFGGRGDAITRAKAANDLAAKATTAVSNYRTEQRKLVEVTGQLRKAEDPRAQTQLIEKVKEQAKATRIARTEAEQLTASAKKASEGIIGQAGAIKNLAAGTAGVVVGTLGFSLALGAAQTVIDLTGKTLGPVIERLTGFRNETAETTKALADQTRAQGGSAQTAVALAAANAGLSESAAKSITPLLEQRAAIESGNTALQDSLKLVHSAIQIRRQQAASGGTPGGIGTNTGGFFDTGAVLLGGIPSTQEQVTKELGGALPSSKDFASNKNATDFLATQPKRSLIDNIVAGTAVGAGNAVAPGAILDPATAAATTSSEFTQKLAESETYIQTFQGALDKGGKQFVIDAQKVGESADQLAKRQTDAATAAQAFSSAGLLDTAKLIRDTGLVVRDAQGNAIKTQAQAQQFYLDINKGFQTPDVGVLIKSLTDRIIPAQRAQFRAEGITARQLQPGAVALNQLAQPTAGLQGGPAFEAGSVGVGDTAAQAAADKYKTLVGGAIKDVNALIVQGRQDLIDLVPSDLRTEFQGVLNEVEATGAAIAKIQTGLQQEQANLAVAEYNNQLRIAKRSLQDARDIQAGIRGETRNTLGGIEGQNIALQRQLQLLQFELQQRQINFRVATAGFVAPGTTPEERAARIAEAKKEAEYAQKQLDIQRQLASNQQRSISISVGRDVQDLIAQVGLLEQGRRVTLDTVAASKALDILNKKQQALVEKAGTYIEEGTKIVVAASQAATQIMAQTGKGFTEILGQTAKAWGIFGTQAQAILNALTGSAPSQNRTPIGGNTAKLGGQASGIVFDSTGPTELTVGEAGKETVAVLRNPRQMSLQQLMGSTREYMPTSQSAGVGAGSGGGIHITVVLTGNTISKDTNLRELAEEIAEAAASKAEERLQRKAGLYSLRRA